MNLNEARKLLIENGYICEFLHKSFPPEVIIDRIKKDLDITLENVKTYRFMATAGQFNFTYSGDIKNIKNKILNIFTIYNYTGNVEKVKDDYYKAAFVNSADEEEVFKYNPQSNFRIFIHDTNVKPETIMRTGIRVKQAGPQLDPRVYFHSFDLAGYDPDMDLNDLAKDITFKGTLEDASFGKYHYLIKLPNHYKIYTDPEGAGGLDWAFTKQSIPPQYILYLGVGGNDFADDTADWDDTEPEFAVTTEEVYNFIKK